MSEQCYYVYKLSSSKFSLGKTLKDVQSEPPLLVNITAAGVGNHAVGLVNPQIKVAKNSKISFQVSDSSLQGYDLKFFYDQKFENQFIYLQH